jgi:hypothetical protein
MTVSNIDKCVNVNDLIDSLFITFICPICKTKKELRFPKSVVDENKNLTTISIPKGLICAHHFQAFIDKNYNIRGYQKVDFEFTPRSENIPKRHRKSRHIKSDMELFKHLICEGNYLEYYPERFTKNQQSKMRNQEVLKKNQPHKQEVGPQEPDPVPQPIPKEPVSPFDKYRERSLEEIYEDFWEFINDENEAFQKFIINDHRRNFDM